MYALIVCCTSLHLKIVLSIVKHLILAVFAAYREWVNLVIVSAWHWSLLYRHHCNAPLSSDKCTYCQWLRMKVSAKCPKYKCKWSKCKHYFISICTAFHFPTGSITLYIIPPLKERRIGKIATNLLHRRTPRLSCRRTPARCSAGTSGRRCASGPRLREKQRPSVLR